MVTQAHSLNLTSVLSVSKRIILARYWHFVSLSLLLFFPLSFSLINISSIIRLFADDHSNIQKLLIAYLLVVYILALCAIGAISYSTHHDFFGESVKFFDSLKSLTFSFFPITSTAIIAHVIICFISLSFILFVGTILMLVHNLGFVINYNSVYFMWFSVIMGMILIAIVLYFYVEWSLAFVVAVVESKWGFAALMRSSYLVKGMKSVSLLVMLYFGVCGVLIVGICSTNMHTIVITMLGSFFLVMFLLRITAANTVLYNYCKALHGELELEAGEGFVREYMNVPSDAGW